jgi:hypothetical protein
MKRGLTNHSRLRLRAVFVPAKPSVCGAATISLPRNPHPWRHRHHFDGKFGVDVSTPPADTALLGEIVG